MVYETLRTLLPRNTAYQARLSKEDKTKACCAKHRKREKRHVEFLLLA